MIKKLWSMLLLFCCFLSACAPLSDHQQHTDNDFNATISPTNHTTMAEHLEEQNVNMQSFRNFTFDETYFYLFDGKEIQRIHRETKTSEPIYQGRDIQRMLAYRGKLYFSISDMETKNDFYCMNLNDLSYRKIGDMAWTFFAYNNLLYFDQGRNIICAKLDGSHAEIVYSVPKPQVPDAVLLDFSIGQNMLYIAVYDEKSDGKIKTNCLRFDLSTKKTQLLFQTAGGISFQVYHDQLYYTSGVKNGFSTIYKFDKSDKEIDLATAYCFNDSSIYYIRPTAVPPTSPSDFALYRCDLQGENKEKIQSMDGLQLGLGKADDGIYLLDMNDHLWRLNLEDARIEKIS